MTRPRPPRLPLGNHTLILDQIGLADHERLGRILEATFLIVSSDTTPANTWCSWVWFIGGDVWIDADDGGEPTLLPNWRGEYERGRAKEFFEALQVSARATPWDADGTEDPSRRLVETMYNARAGDYRGATLEVRVTEKTAKSGRALRQASWHPPGLDLGVTMLDAAAQTHEHQTTSQT